MLAFNAGASKKIFEQISKRGSNLLMIVPGSSSSSGMRMGFGSEPSLTVMDSDAILKECPSVLDAAPVINGTCQLVYGNQNWSTGVLGTTPNMLNVRDWPLVSGKSFSAQDVRNSTKVCLLGKTVIDNLFGSLDPVGKIIRIKKVPFTVIGVLEPKGQSLMGIDNDDIVYVPVTTAQKKLFGTLFPGMVRLIMVKAKSLSALASAEREVNELIRQRHRIGEKQDDDFSVRNLTQMFQIAENAMKVLSLLLGSIASVSLLVGGIGIMNIMLVSVTERTREIGIRMAVGAKTWDIRLQFLIEALILSLIGGTFGIAIGVTAATIISATAGWPTIVSPFSIILALGFSGMVGIFFGFYPAYKASLLNPIDALRYE